jgi:hypothetical protein
VIVVSFSPKSPVVTVYPIGQFDIALGRTTLARRDKSERCVLRREGGDPIWKPMQRSDGDGPYELRWVALDAHGRLLTGGVDEAHHVATIEDQCPVGDEVPGSAFLSDPVRLPASLRQARQSSLVAASHTWELRRRLWVCRSRAVDAVCAKGRSLRRSTCQDSSSLSGLTAWQGVCKTASHSFTEQGPEGRCSPRRLAC